MVAPCDWGRLLYVAVRNPHFQSWKCSYSWRGHSPALWLGDFLLVKADKKVSVKITLLLIFL